jgi:hypothetical protein
MRSWQEMDQAGWMHDRWLAPAEQGESIGQRRPLFLQAIFLDYFGFDADFWLHCLICRWSCRTSCNFNE